MLQFHLDATDNGARRGVLHSRAGEIDTPAFMPVGTQASVKSLTPAEVRRTGAQIILNNAYHLYLRPGVELLERLGGVHCFQAWDGAILTDSGGYQIFSLSPLHKVMEEGLTFKSHIDGSEHFMSPEKSIQVQQRMGSDILMSFDQPIPWGADLEEIRDATERTYRWAVRGKEAWNSETGQALLGIVQGGFDATQRRMSAEMLVSLDFPGYAVGGLSVGEPKEVMWAMLDIAAPILPVEKPRYLMGVGTLPDLVRAVARGMDMFDCVLPTRMGRNGTAFTWNGRLNLRNSQYENDSTPLDSHCRCDVCRTFSRAYLRHLLKSGEILAIRSLSYHNLFIYQQIMGAMRKAIEKGTFTRWANDFLQNYQESVPSVVYNKSIF